MSTKFLSPGWRMPRNANQSKSSNYSIKSTNANVRINISSPAEVGITSSFSFWLKRTDNTVVSQPYRVVGNGLYGMYISSSAMYVRYGGAAITINNTATLNAIALTDWVHWVITREEVTSTTQDIRLYANGILVYSLNGTSGLGTLDSKVDSLMYQLQATDFMNSFSIFDYALSSSQVTTLYGSSSTGIGNPMSLSPKPVAYYPLGDQDAFNGSNYLVPNSSLKDYVFDFDGSNDYIDYGNVDALKLGAGDFTWSSWINPDSWGSSFEALYTCLASNGVWIGIDGTNFVLRIVNGSNIIAYSALPTVNTWTNICITRVSGACTLYYNGVSVATATSTHNFNVNGNVNLGGYGTYGNFNGKISNVQVFNTALPATGSNSVETLYNNGSPLTSMSGFTSLVSWWKLDASDTYDGTNWTIEDHAGSNDGTSSGMTQANLVQSDLSFTSGYSPYALDFDGSGDKITLNSSVSTGNYYSVSLWLNPENVSSGNSYLFSDSTSSPFKGLALDQGSSTAGGFGNFYYYTGLISIVNNTTILGDVWSHIVISFDVTGQEIKFYINGVLDKTSTGVANISSSINEFAIRSTGNAYNGKLSNISIWNTALTSAQVTEIYSEGIPQNLNNHSAYSNLVSWWQLGSNSSFDGNDWIVADEKGSNNGTSTGMPVGALVNGVGTTANGVSSGMSEGSLVGDAPYSTANALSTNMAVTARVSGVSDAAITTGGTGYVTGTNIATTGGSGTNCTINITTVSGGVITAITINNGGSNYVIGDVLTISGGNGNATITVSGLNTP